MARRRTSGRRFSNKLPSGARRRLNLEHLEDRRLLAITVDTHLDVVDLNDGMMSLREAVFAANTAGGADTIDFSPALSADGPVTILLTQGELVITDSLTIDGLGVKDLTIDASGSDSTPMDNNGDGSRVFTIDDGINATSIDVTIRNVQLTGGDVSGDGGAIASYENLTVELATIYSNSAVNGGGIHSVGGTLLVKSSEFRSNFAAMLGGGVWTSSDLIGSRVEDCLFLSNRAFTGGGGIWVGGDGGLVIVNSTLTTNGIDAIRTESPAGTTSVLYCTFASNFGGYCFRATEVQRIEGSIFSSNTAQELSGEFEVNYSLIQNVGSAIIHGSNNVLGQLPRLAALADYGGPTRTFGLAVSSPAVNAGNPLAAAGVADVPEFDQRGGPYTRVFGGRIDMGAFERQNSSAPLSLIVDTLIDELDGDYSLGDLSLREAVSLANGNSGFEDLITFSAALSGETIVLRRGQLSIADSVQIDASALPAGIRIDATGNDPTPGIIDGEGSGVIRFAGGDGANNPLNLKVMGLALTGADTSSSGGAISTGENLYVYDSILYGNAAGNGGAISINANSDVDVRIERTKLTGNVSDHYGGALYLDLKGGAAHIIDSQVSANFAANQGGGINVTSQNNGLVTIEGTLVSDNRVEVDSQSGGRGGGIDVQVESGGVFRLVRSVISGNTATGDSVAGGGLSFTANDASASVEDSVIQGNRALDTDTSSPIGDGGGMLLYTSTLGRITLSNVSVIGNQASGDGGGIAARVRSDSASLEITNSTISENQSDGNGGGINVDNWSGVATPILLISHSTITRNVANSDHDGVGSSGGAHTSRQVITFDHTIVAGNFDLAATSPDLGKSGSGSAIVVHQSLIGIAGNSLLSEAPIGSPDANGNLIGGPVNGMIDPLLGPLANNGGETLPNGKQILTHALLPGSPALNAGDAAAVAGVNGVPEFDQRGAPWSRIVGGRIDMGAVESQANPLPGDYNFNGIVDAADFSVWQDTAGSVIDLRADGSGPVVGVPDGVVDQHDYEFWKENFGNLLSGQGGSSLAVSQQLAGEDREDSAVQFGESSYEFAISIEGDRRVLSPRPVVVSSVNPRHVDDERIEGLVAYLAARSELSRHENLGEHCVVDEISANPESSHAIDDVFASLGADFGRF